MRAGRLAIFACLALVTLVLTSLVLDRLLPPDLSRLAASPVVEDRHAVMLRAFRTADGQWRLPADPKIVSPNYLHMLLAVEDKRFFDHHGVDPLALTRAIWQLATRGHVISGGSTLTMQVARLLEPRPRTVRSKAIEMFRAFQLEARMGKADILRAYLTLTPMGGNLEGVRAGSLAWFGKEPAVLSDAEAAMLVALPRAPRATRPDGHQAHAQAARRRVLVIAGDAGLIDEAGQTAANATPVPNRRRPLPSLTPHLTERLIADGFASSPIRTALDGRMQTDLERLLRGTLDGLARPINVAAILADWHTGEVLARAGSADYYDVARRGMVDMTRAIRSPGSTLKPFVYGMAFDGLLAHPASLVRDEPTRFDDYAPHNFDGGFDGDVTVRHALQASLNLPAVVVLQRIGPVAFVDRLRSAGLSLLFADATVAPSLPVVLGGVGITLDDLVAGYAALADGGIVKPLIERLGTSADDRRAMEPLMRRPAADVIVDILAGVPPPKGFAGRAGRIAYKTGTSYRFRDGWAVGFDGSRVAGIWIGRADGATCQPCVGAVAASLLFKLFDLLPPDPLSARMLSPVFAGPPPPALVRLGPSMQVRHQDAPHIAFPLAGARLLVDDTAPEIHISVQGGARPYRWIADGHPIESQPFTRDAVWRPTEGFSTLTVVDALGHSDDVKVRVVRRGEASAVDDPPTAQDKR